MADFDPEALPADTWQLADPLDFAWFGYAPNGLKTQYREAGDNPVRTAALRQMMEAEVRGRIGDGELTAYGILTAPKLEDTARRIPPTLFQAQSASVDWDQGIITSLGRTFAEVRVCDLERQELEATTIAVPTREQAPRTKRGGGRPSQYPQARDILELLFVEPSYQALAAARLLEPFNRAYLDKYCPPDGKLSPISERSLRDHLKRYRQELAETSLK
jgi:hypothetical protein